MDNRIFDGLPILGSDAGRLGLSPKGLRQLLHDHRLRRIFRGVYVDAAVLDTRTLRSRALHLVMPPHGVLYGCSAAWALGVDAFPPAQRFNFTPTCVVQYVVRDHRGRKLARLDHAYPHIRVAAEYDGAEYHSHHEDASYDEERRAYLRKVLGWHFVVAGKKDILGKDDSFEVELGQLLGLVPLLPRQW